MVRVIKVRYSSAVGAFDTSLGVELSLLFHLAWSHPQLTDWTAIGPEPCPHGCPTNAATNGTNWHLCMPWLEESKDQVVEGKRQQPTAQQPGHGYFWGIVRDRAEQRVKRDETLNSEHS